jgi:hypothetical protein
VRCQNAPTLRRRLEALVVMTSRTRQHARMTVEQRAIAALCRDWLSIAEISARGSTSPSG